jgi:hypothetical protein
MILVRGWWPNVRPAGMRFVDGSPQPRVASGLGTGCISNLTVTACNTQSVVSSATDAVIRTTRKLPAVVARREVSGSPLRGGPTPASPRTTPQSIGERPNDSRLTDQPSTTAEVYS